jgi:hypothetical protein
MLWRRKDEAVQGGRMSATDDELSGQRSAMRPSNERPDGVATAHIDRDISKRIGRDGVDV